MPASKICCIGLGYVGLPTAALLAANGVHVHGVDINQTLVLNLKQGKTNLDEPDLQALVRQTVQDGKLTVGVTPVPADVFMIAVPTPFLPDRTPDLSYVMLAAENIAPFLVSGNLVILESTSPVGTTEDIRDRIAALRPDLDILGAEPDVFFAYCPERVLPGNTINELTHNSRSIGGLTPEGARRAKTVYQMFCKGELIKTDSRTAEMTKLVENSFRDVNIAFANELALLGRELGVDIHKVIALANHHPRVNILSPGIGVGGHCIPVDPWFIVAQCPEHARLIRRAREINDSIPDIIASEVLIAARETGIQDVLVLGLAYKPNIGDFRESPSVALLKTLAQSDGVNVFFHDPYMTADEEKYLPSNAYAVSFDQISKKLSNSISIIATPHSAYADLDFSGVAACVDPSGFLGKQAAAAKRAA